MRREPVDAGARTQLSARQKLILFNKSESLSAEAVLSTTDAEVDVAFMLKHGCRAVNLVAADVGPRDLKGMGATDATTLRTLGFDALYLTDAKFAADANATYGAESVRRAFLVSAADAVAVAGCEAVDLLGISTEDLLQVCAGAPLEAFSVLKQLPASVSLAGVSPSTLLDTGLRKSKLSELGYSLAAVIAQTGASATHLQKLGFGLATR